MIFYVRNTFVILSIRTIIVEFLGERLPSYVDPFTQPWVQCHSGVGVQDFKQNLNPSKN